MSDSREAVHRGDPVTLAAELLVRFAPPDTGPRLVRDHGPDRSGHCLGCRHGVTSAPVSPCRLRLIGEAAVRLVGEATLAALRRTADAGDPHTGDEIVAEIDHHLARVSSSSPS